MLHSNGLQLNVPQSEFINSDKPFRGFCAGYRAGKTFVGCVRLWMLAAGHPGIKLGYFAPTYPHVRDILYPTISEVGELFAETIGLPCTTVVNKSEHSVRMFIDGVEYAVVRARSMERPESIVGFDISHALVDEIDCMKKAKADDAWKRIVARMSSVRSDYPVNTVDFTTTPEGFNWMYDFFVSQLQQRPELKKFYELVKASTRQNAKNLPDDYIEKLYATYPPNLVDAYIDGNFVNLTSGSVYIQFDRKLNNSDEELQPHDAIYIGMDFNVGNMSGVVHIIKDGNPIAVDEIIGAYDTPDIIEQIKRRYWNETGHNQFMKTRNISIYPDSSGDSRKTVNAGQTDIKLLNQAGFHCAYSPSNPRVRDRINSMNRAFCDNNGERRYKINTKKCPVYTEDLEQQVYADNGEPDKSAGKDHRPDAGGYFIAHEYPIIRPITTKNFRMSY